MSLLSPRRRRQMVHFTANKVNILILPANLTRVEEVRPISMVPVHEGVETNTVKKSNDITFYNRSQVPLTLIFILNAIHDKRLKQLHNSYKLQDGK